MVERADATYGMMISAGAIADTSPDAASVHWRRRSRRLDRIPLYGMLINAGAIAEPTRERGTGAVGRVASIEYHSGGGCSRARAHSGPTPS